MAASRRRRILGWLVVIALLASAGEGLAQAPPTWPVVLASTGFTVPVASGIFYSHFGVTTEIGPLDIHHLRIDLDNPSVRLGVALAHDRLMSDDETVSSMVARSGAIAGVNGDYFDIHDSGMPINILVRDGVLLRSPWRFVALGLARDGTVQVVRFRWTGTLTITETGETRALDGYNGGIAQDGIVALTDVRGYGAPPPEPGFGSVAGATPWFRMARSGPWSWPQARRRGAPFPRSRRRIPAWARRAAPPTINRARRAAGT